MRNSPCRRGPEEHPHHCSWAHASLVDSYRAARDAQEARAEEWSLGYGTELKEFYRDVEPRVVLKVWLENQEKPDEC